MIHGIEGVLLFSHDPEKLAGFYKEKVGLKATFEGEMGEDGHTFYMFEMKEGSPLSILYHDKVKGTNTNPERMMLNFEVDNIEDEASRLEKAQVKKIADIYHIQDYGYVATFADPDDNYFQLVKTKE